MVFLLSSAGGVKPILHNIAEREQSILQNIPYLQYSSHHHRVSKMVTTPTSVLLTSLNILSDDYFIRDILNMFYAAEPTNMVIILPRVHLIVFT